MKEFLRFVEIFRLPKEFDYAFFVLRLMFLFIIETRWFYYVLFNHIIKKMLVMYLVF